MSETVDLVVVGEFCRRLRSNNVIESFLYKVGIMGLENVVVVYLHSSVLFWMTEGWASMTRR